MADVFTGATSAAGSGQMSNQVLTAYQRSALFALREGVVFDALCRVRPGNLTSPGNPVKFPFWADLSAATTALTETVDVDAVALSDSLVTVTPAEYGNAVLVTIRLRTDDFLLGFDADVANLINYNMVDTIDTLARTAADGSTNVEYINHVTESSVTATATITAALVRKKRAQLRGASVVPWSGMAYAAVIHPDQVYDLMAETGEAAWTVPANRADDGRRVWDHSIGRFAQFDFLETPRAKINTDGGASNVDTYTAYFMGQEALAKAESIPARIVEGPVTDKLRRFMTLGWHTYAGWDTLREASIRRLVGASSIGSN